MITNAYGEECKSCQQELVCPSCNDAPEDDKPTLRERLAEEHPDLLCCDGLDHALIGVAYRFGMEVCALYDMDKVLKGYEEQGMDPDEALEYFEFNVIGAWVGGRTPVFTRLGDWA